MKWFRLYSEILDDPKMREMTPDERWILIYLMAYACEIEQHGKIPFSDADIAWRLRVDETVLTECMKRYETLKIVTRNGNSVSLTHWMKRQYDSDNSTLRVRKFRMKRYMEHPMKRYSNVLDTDPEAETEQIKPPKPPKGGVTYDQKFLNFWELYPQKIGKGKAFEEWKKVALSNDVYLSIMESVKNHKQNSKKWLEGYIPNPSTFLHQRRWEDQPDGKQENSDPIRRTMDKFIGEGPDPETH